MLFKTVGGKYTLNAFQYLVCCFLATLGATSSQAQSYVARNQFYGVENGLSHREVNAIHQDKQGFMWFGTRYGLNRFDGYRFTWHTSERNGLPFNDIESITEDDNGYLWLMGPVSQPTICLYHPLRKEVFTLKEKFGVDLKLHYNNPRGQLKKSSKGTIYFLADAPLRLMSYHPSRGLKSASLPANWQQFFLSEVSEHGTLWGVVNDTMLMEIDSTGKVLQRFVHDGRIQLRMGGRQNGVEFYYATGPFSGGVDRIFYIDTQGNRKEVPIETVQQERPYVPELIFRFDSTGLMWTHNRLLSPGGSVVVSLSEQFPELDATGLRSFLRDRSGAIWIGGDFGVYSSRVRPNRFNTMMQSARKTTLGEGNACRGIFVDEEYLYVNMQEDGLYRVARKGNEKTLLYKNAHEWGHLGLYNSPDGQFLYVGSSARVLRYQKNTGDTLTWNFPPSLVAWAMYQPDSNLLLVGGKRGLYTVNVRSNQVAAFDRYNQFNELADAHILFIAPDNKGQVWICSSSGLYTWAPSQGITARYWSKGEGQFYLPTDEFQHFYQDEDGTYWIGTAFTGLLHWDKKNNTIRQYTRVDGLSNNNIYAVYPDGLGNLWLTSNNGLMQFNRSSGKTRTYLVHDGIAHNEFNRLSHFMDNSGRMYFGGLNGITTFHPGSFSRKDKTYSPPLRIALFQQFDGGTDKLEDRTASLLANKKITVYPGDRFLVFEMSLLTFEDQNHAQYAYKLDGVDNDWNYQTERTLRLSGLPYGEHVLRIKGQSSDGSWSAEEIIPIHVMWPVYLRPWFLILLGLLLVSFVYGIFLLRNWQHQQQQLTLEIEIARVTAKLKLDNQTIERQAEELRHLDALKSRFFANVSHELRTPLTLMLSPLNTVLKNKKLDDPSRQLLNLASQNGEQLLRLLAEILDLSKLESGKLELAEKPTHLQSLLRKQVAQFEAHAKRINIDLSLDYQARKNLVVMLDVKNTERILNNLLSNAMKFTPAGGSVLVQVVENTDNLEIRVKDTGRGVHPDDLPYIFDRYYQSKRPDTATEGGTGIGLALSFELTRMFGGSLRVESALGKGSTFYFNFPKKEVADAIEEVADTMLSEPFGTKQKEDQGEVVSRSPSKPRLLVVEDHDSLLQYLLSLLKPDFDVVGVRHGREALDVLEQDDHEVDLILSDIMMPVMDGFQLLEHLKSNDAYRHLPVVMLTARADWTDKLNALRLGVDDYLLKPFREEELRARIDNLLHNVLQRKTTATTSKEEKQTPRPLFSAEEQAWLEDVEKMVQQNLPDTHFNVDQLSDMLFISRRQLNRRLQQLTGLTPVQYIREARLAHARRLLENRTYSTVKSVVLASGMTDTEHFSKLFREKYGRSPSDYAEPTPGDARNDG
ncbi:MAG: response regulator [Saprospiraceae bacterium]|nr:response regulator [Saprospiraceae bacterium]